MVVQPNDATWCLGLSGALQDSDISLVKPTSNPSCKRVQLGVTYNSVGPDAICYQETKLKGARGRPQAVPIR